MSLESLIDYMQDCTNFQSEDLGVGLEYHRQKNIMWVLNFWQIVIDEYPAMGENITVGTQAFGFEKMFGHRNFLITHQGDAYRNTVRLLRRSGREKQIYNVDKVDYENFILTDDDEVSVEAVLDRFSNKVEVRGAVYRAGMYQLDSLTGTIKQLICQAEGLRGDAFLNRALLKREREDLSHEMIPVDLRKLMEGIIPDLPLQKNDVLYISSIRELEKEGTLAIYGDVANPGYFPFAKNMTIQDLILKAGGLLESASTVRIDVSRRIKDAKSTSSSSVIGKIFGCIKNGIVLLLQ